MGRRGRRGKSKGNKGPGGSAPPPGGRKPGGKHKQQKHKGKRGARPTAGRSEDRHPHRKPPRPESAPPEPVVRRPEPPPTDTETYRGFQLHRFQQQALDAIRAGSSVLVAAPTGAGKTLVADFAIEQALAEGKRICYTAPVKALSNQKFRDFRETLGDDVGIMTGDVTINAGASLLIMTTEVFRNTIFEDPKNLDDCHAVIFDEIHYLDDRERGTVWEESIIFAPEHIRIVGLSATIPNIEDLAEWMRSIRTGTLEVIVHERRPVPLRHHVWHGDLGVKSLPELKKIVKGRGRRRPQDRGGGGRAARFRRGWDHRYLLDYIEKHDLLPCLYFSFSRRECGERAEENAARQLLTDVEQADMLARWDDLADRYQLEDTEASRRLRHLASRGVLYHHAGLLPIHKEIVERLFTTGLIKMLFTTETFALGVNMPARTVGFAALKKFDGVRVGWLLAREYGQMSGRAGRQGIDDTGYVYARVDDRDMDLRAIEHLFEGAIEPVQSRFNIDYATLMNLYARIGENVVVAYERSLARWQREQREAKQAENGWKPRDRMPKEEAVIGRRLQVLKRLGYIRNGELTDKGRFAAAVQGFEIHAAELLDEGLLHRCDAEQLVLVFCAIVFEERRGDASERVDPNVIEGLRRSAEHRISLVRRREYEAGLEELGKELDWKMSGPALHWARGCSWEELGETTTVSDGDLVRTLRQAIQVMRNVRNALHHSGALDLETRFSEAIRMVNRDVVDARRQLELG